MKTAFYTLDNILRQNADYNMIYGERSNGKTTAVLGYGIKDHIESNYENQLALIRRYEEDYKGQKGQQMFEGIVNLGWIEEWSKGKYNNVYYFSQRWYLCHYDENGERDVTAEKPFCLGFAISSEEHYKSYSFPKVMTILFDEFISRLSYLNEEFVRFQNLLSTIIRLRTDIKIFMCGNTINKYCPYFAEMGLTGIRNQRKGTIDIYTYGDSDLRVAVEYSDFPSKKKPSNKYFAFNNPKLDMITSGGWEISIYPHLPVKYKTTEIDYKFYIIFDGDILQGNIITVDDATFLYIHRKTTPIREDNEQLVYQQNPDHRLNYRMSILAPYTKLDKFITFLVETKKIFYQDNEVGEVFRNYLEWCVKN